MYQSTHLLANKKKMSDSSICKDQGTEIERHQVYLTKVFICEYPLKYKMIRVSFLCRPLPISCRLQRVSGSGERNVVPQGGSRA